MSMTRETRSQINAAPAPDAPPIKIAIIEDQRDIREGLGTIFTFTDGYRCTGCYRSMEEALEKIQADLPNVALVDIGLPGMNGIEGIRILKERHPNLVLLMLPA
jgi:DNA-binding NarL/FixJ family response regulator